MTKIEAPELLSMDQITELYGKDFLPYAKFFSNEGRIIEPVSYKAFAELVLYTYFRNGNKDKYINVLNIYNKTADSKFSKTIRFMKDVFIYRGSFMESWDHKIKNIFDNHFKNGKFIREHDLEMVIYDNFYSYDFNQEIKVFRQVQTDAGPLDICILHDGSAYLLELKKGAARRKDVYQILDYFNSYSPPDGINERVPVLVASDFDEKVLLLARENGIGCYKYVIEDELPYTSIYFEEVNANKKFDDFLDSYYRDVGFYISGLIPEIAKIREFDNYFNDVISRRRNTLIRLGDLLKTS